MKIGLLIGSRMALPALMDLAQNNSLCGVATTSAAIELEPIVVSTAATHNIPYTRFRKGDELQDLNQFIEQCRPEVVFVMGFPTKITAGLLSKVPGGYYNFHPGKLPEMRGADPIFEVLCRGIQQTTFTVLKMNEDWDAGGIVGEHVATVPLGMTYGMLTTHAAYAFQSIAMQLANILRQGLQPVIRPQHTDNVNYWKRRTLPDFFLDWERQSAQEICCLVNACNPVVKGAVATINNWRIGILAAEISDQKTNDKPGTIISISRNGILVACTNAQVLIIRIVYTEEGILEAYRLSEYGIVEGMYFQGLSKLVTA